MVAGRTVVITGVVVLVLTGCAVQRTVIRDTPSSAAPAPASGTTPGRSCPPPMNLATGTGISIDYIDTFRLLGHDYVESLDPVPPTWDPNRPGTPAGRIVCTLDTYQVDPSYRLQDGDATFIPVGTPVYLITTSRGTTEAVVSVGGHWKTYQPLPST